MKNPKMMMIVAALVVVLGAGLVFSLNSSDGDDAASSEVMEKKDGEVMEKDGDAMEKEEGVMEKDGDAMEKHDDSEAMEKDGEAMEKDGDVMEKEDSAMEKSSNFITVSQYDADKSTYSDSDKVLFFHASWCPICQGIEDEIEEDSSKIPEDAVFIKADFDSETELRQKYGVTTQYTFVQIDNEGNQIAKWSATSLDKAISGIQ